MVSLQLGEFVPSDWNVHFPTFLDGSVSRMFLVMKIHVKEVHFLDRMKKIEFANEEIMSDFGKRAVLIMATLFTYIFQLMSDVKIYR